MLRRLRRTAAPPPTDGQARRRAFFKSAKGLSRHVAAPIGDEVIVLRTDDDGIGKGVFVYRWRKDMSGLREAVGRLEEWGIQRPEEPVFVDVGANIGTTTVMALRRFGFASAVAIEPAPSNFLSFRLNVIANDLETRVTAINAAVGDREEERVPFDVSRPSCGAFRVAKEETEDTVAVDLVTLDGLVDRSVIEPARTGMLWIDAVGYEPNVLAGATHLLEAGVPTVVSVRRKVRLDPEARSSLSDLTSRHFTDVVELRRLHVTYPIAELDALLDQVERVTDVLLVRR